MDWLRNAEENLEDSQWSGYRAWYILGRFDGTSSKPLLSHGSFYELEHILFETTCTAFHPSYQQAMHLPVGKIDSLYVTISDTCFPYDIVRWLAETRFTESTTSVATMGSITWVRETEFLTSSFMWDGRPKKTFKVQCFLRRQWNLIHSDPLVDVCKTQISVDQRYILS